MRVGDRALEKREEVRAPRLVFDEREDLLELVDDEDELRLVVGEERFTARSRPRSSSSSCSSRPAGGCPRRGAAPPRAPRADTRPETSPRPPALGAGSAPCAEPRHEAGAHDRRLAAAARADDGEEARLREPLDEVLRQRLPAEEVGGVVLVERAQALVRVARLGAAGSGRIERAPEGEIAGDVFALGPDGHDVHRLLEPLEPHGAALDVVEALDLAREVRHLPGLRAPRPGRRGEQRRAARLSAPPR